MKSLSKKEQKRVLGKYLDFPPDAVNGRVHGSLEITTGYVSAFRWRGGGLSSHQAGGDKKTSRNKKRLIGQILLSVGDSTGVINYVPLALSQSNTFRDGCTFVLK